jgi:hypothetical protein
MAKAAAIPYVMQDNFVSVLVGGRPFQLLASHPTFRRMVRALKGRKWDRVPDLVNLAQSISNRSHGNVEVREGKVFYKGSEVDSSLTRMMVSLVEHEQPVTHMLRFMDNLYENPNPRAIQGLYDFLQRYSMPITDDGCFVAYKRVDGGYKDCHSHTIDNSVGTVNVMPRKDVDKDSANVCSRGYHFCSRAYLTSFSGEHLMAIKVNPADVDEIPEVDCGKGRTWRYEVIDEVPNQNYEKEDAEYFQRPLIAVGRDRKALIKRLLALSSVARLVARTERDRARYRRTRKRLGDNHPQVQVAGLTRQALGKASLGRLRQWYERFAADNPPAPAGRPAVFANPTRPARIAAGLNIVAVANEMKVRPSDVYKQEKAERPTQRFIDNYIAAVQRLSDAGYGVGFESAKAQEKRGRPSVLAS